jgi:hypothetical protein
MPATPEGPPVAPPLPVPTALRHGIVYAVVGMLGGFALMLAGVATIITGPVPGLIYGIGFAALFRHRASGNCSGLPWGLAYGLLLWLVVIATNQNPSASTKDYFANLVGYILCFGAPLGLTLALLKPQSASSCGRCFGGHRRRLGLWQMDGAS